MELISTDDWDRVGLTIEQVGKLSLCKHETVGNNGTMSLGR